MDIDLQDLDIRTLKQELFVIKKILEQIHFYGEDNTAKFMLAEFNSKYFPINSEYGYDETQLARITDVFKFLENNRCIQDLEYGDAMMARTTVHFLPIPSRLRAYKVQVLKELRVRGEIVDDHIQSKDILVNGKLKYDVDNNELQFDEGNPIKLSATSDYGRFLILLMSNLDQRQSYTQISDAVGIDYKAEDSDPEKDPSIKRQVSQIKDDLVSKLKKVGMAKEEIKKTIVARDGYKMNRMN